MNLNFSRLSVFVFPVIVIFSLVVWFYFQSLDARGQFVYALDDPYIHLAIAKNFAFHGVWGTTPQEFASASSSPLWTALLALCLKLSGSNLMLGSLWPLVLTLVSSLLLVWVLWRETSRYLSPLVSCLTSVIVVLAVPVPTLVVSGQEHILHCVVIFLLVSGYARILAQGNAVSKRDWNVILFLTAIAGLIRYESLFLLAVFGLLLIARRRFKEATIFVVVGALPLVLFGIMSVQQGWPPVPNSIWLKANSSSSLFSLSKYMELVNKAPEVLFCLFVLVFVGLWLQFNSRFSQQEKFAGDLTGSELKNRCALLAGLFLLHLTLARVGWLFRYEAYLLFASTLVFLPLLTKISLRSEINQQARRSATFVLIAFVVIFVSQRILLAIQYTPKSLTNIRDQQWQMALFFTRYFPEAPLALNDIGAVSYFRESPVLDLYGLASLEVAQSRRAGNFNAASIEKIARDRKIEYIAIYPDWFDTVSLEPGSTSDVLTSGGDGSRTTEIPVSWIRCADWDLQNAYFGPKLAFFATSPQGANKLRTAMREFAVSLPSREICTIIDANGERRRAN